MSLSTLAFASMAALTCGFFVVLAARELGFEFFPETQIGDSSLSPRSVDTLTVTAFASALLICLF